MMASFLQAHTKGATDEAILRALLYFDIFSHPLTAEEIHLYLPCEASLENIKDTLSDLCTKGKVFQYGNFYQVQAQADWSVQRLECNQRADTTLPIAQRMARLIGAFPYVRSVCVSGSLSKHCMKADSDVDFFIMTDPGRLWLTRTMLVLFKKIFLLNSHKYFCVNYFIDTEHLEIEEKNQFTATEITTLLPLYGPEAYKAFVTANGWTRLYFPQYPEKDPGLIPAYTKKGLKKILEWLFNGRLGNWLDRKGMEITLRFWRQKFKQIDQKTFDLALKSRRYVSKHHPMYFQKKVLDAYQLRLEAWGFK
jgi:hypothetical protein